MYAMRYCILLCLLLGSVFGFVRCHSAGLTLGTDTLAKRTRLHAFPSAFDKQPMLTKPAGISETRITAAASPSVNAASLNAIAKLLSTCGLGGIAARAGILDKNAIGVLSKLVYNVFQPCLLFANVCMTVANAGGGDTPLAVLPMAAAYQVFLGFVIGKVLSFFIHGTKASDDSKYLLTCTTFGNSGPLPFVFADALFRLHENTALAPKAVAYISLYLLGWQPLFWVLCTTILSKNNSGSKKDQLKIMLKRVMSPPIIASISGLIVGSVPFLRNLFMSRGLLNPIFESIKTLGGAYLPAVLLVLAGSLMPAKEAPPAKGAKPQALAPVTPRDKLIKNAIGVYLARFLLIPTITFSTITYARKFSPFLEKLFTDKMLVFVMLLEACMPSAQNGTVILTLNGDTNGAAMIAKLLVFIYVAGIPAISYWIGRVMTFSGVSGV